MILSASPAAPAALPATPPPVARTANAPPSGERPAAPLPSPRLRVDAALNVVVLEFLGADGKLDHSLPSPRELESYRRDGAPSPHSIDLRS
jgi:hypothetical protein